MIITILSEETLRKKSPDHLRYILRRCRKSLGWLEGRVNGEDWRDMGEGPPEAWIPQRDRVQAYKHLLVGLMKEVPGSSAVRSKPPYRNRRKS